MAGNGTGEERERGSKGGDGRKCKQRMRFVMFERFSKNRERERERIIERRWIDVFLRLRLLERERERERGGREEREIFVEPPTVSRVPATGMASSPRCLLKRSHTFPRENLQ
jgi:hypothetical protein